MFYSHSIRAVSFAAVALLFSFMGAGCAFPFSIKTASQTNSSFVTSVSATVTEKDGGGTAEYQVGTREKVSGPAPVEFTLGTVTAGAKKTPYTIKIVRDKPIRQVDIDIKSFDASGNVLSEFTEIWENIRNSVAEPIVFGRTYSSSIFNDKGMVRIEAKLHRVYFTDDSVWSAF